MKILFPILALFLASLCIAEKKSYEGYKLVRITLKNKDLIEKIESVEDPDYDVWGVLKTEDGYAMEVSLSPQVFNKYMLFFRSLKVDVEIVNNNVQDIFDQEQKSIELNAASRAGIINSYARFNDIRSFIYDTADANSDLASTYVIGKTLQGRDLVVIKFKTPTSKRAIWIDCGIHAREWVTPASCVYFIDRIVSEYRSGDAQTVALLNKYELHILPVYNPDGYEYTHTSTRLWRKNRRINGLSILEQCNGVDLNRNADWKWNTGGASSSTCSDVYAGPNPASENETIAVANTLRANAGNWDAYYSVHSYGNWWLLPWGHDPLDIAPNFAELKANGDAGAQAIKDVAGQVFTVGSSSELLYVTTGSTADWAYGALDIKISVTLELRAGPTTGGNSGFVLPIDQLPDCTRETWAGIKASMVDVSNRRP